MKDDKNKKDMSDIPTCPHCETGVSKTEIEGRSCWTCGRSFDDPVVNATHPDQKKLTQNDLS